MSPSQNARVYITDASDRAAGIRNLIDQFDLALSPDSRVALKANYNSDDPFPASTHIDTLRAICIELQNRGAASISMAERSGMGNTADVLENRGVNALAAEYRLNVHVLERARGKEWVHVDTDDMHWERGFLLARDFTESDTVVQTCCLKTHRFGGHFTMSLKNSVGLIARYDERDGYDYMRELHSSPFQRSMIAEINAAYPVHLAIMDAEKGFSRGGPDRGEIIHPGLILASNDRIALDAVGVAILRLHGTTPDVTRGRIFEQEQLNRAADLGIGVLNASQIDLVPLDPASEQKAQGIQRMLDEEG